MEVGQSMVVSGVLVDTDDEGFNEVVLTGGWCGRCIAEWDARMGLEP